MPPPRGPATPASTSTNRRRVSAREGAQAPVPVRDHAVGQVGPGARGRRPPPPWPVGSSRIPASARVSATAPASNATIGVPGPHGLEQRDAEALVLGETDEDVGVGVPGGELGVGEVLAVADGVGQAQLVGQREHRLGVRLGHRRAHQVEPGIGVVPPSVEPERLDQVVLGLVGGDPPDEEEHGPRPVIGGQPGRLRLVDTRPVSVHLDQDGNDGGGRAAELAGARWR